MVHVASSQKPRGDEAKDGRVTSLVFLYKLSYFIPPYKLLDF
jgi:hypothetical protein